MMELLAMKSTSPTGPRRWLSLPKVAKRLSLSGEAVLALIRTGELPAKLVGGRRWFVALDDIDVFQVRRHGRGAA